MGPGDDALAVSRVYAASWRAAYRGIVPQAFLDEMAEDRWCGFLTGGGAESLLLLDGQHRQFRQQQGGHQLRGL